MAIIPFSKNLLFVSARSESTNLTFQPLNFPLCSHICLKYTGDVVRLKMFGIGVGHSRF